MKTKADTPAVQRDPRREPRVGDELTRGEWTRRIIIVPRAEHFLRGWLVCYERTHGKTQNREVRTCYTRAGWWRWARNAEVVTVADEGGAA